MGENLRLDRPATITRLWATGAPITLDPSMESYVRHEVAYGE